MPADSQDHELLLTQESCRHVAQIRFDFTVDNRDQPQDGVVPKIKLAELGGELQASTPPILSATQSPTFVSGTISESSSILQARNTLTVVAQASADLPAGAKVTLRGLQGAVPRGYTPPSDGPVNLGSIMSTVVSSGEWNPRNNEAVFTLARSIPPLTDFEFAFDMMNPPLRQTPNDIVILAGADGLTVSSFTLEGKVLGAAIAPRFDLTEISESSLIAGAANTISITLRANTELIAGEEITISRLQGSLTPSTSLLPVQSSRSYLEPSGVWDSTGILKLKVFQDIERDTTFDLKFSLVNPFPSQTPVVPEVKTALIPTTAVLSKDLKWHEGFARWRGLQPPTESNGQVRGLL